MVQLIGRITKDAAVRTLANDRSVVNFSIALNYSFKKKDGERVKRVTFVNCSYWRSATVAQYLTKGKIIEVGGFLFANAYNNLQGEAVAHINMQVDDFTLHSSKPQPATGDTPEAAGRTRKKKTPETAAEVTEPIADLPF